MIQDIAPKRYHNHYYDAPLTAECPVLVYRDKEICVDWGENGLRFPSYAMLAQELQSTRYLFSIDDTHYFLGSCGESFAPPAGFAFHAVAPLFRTAKPQDRAFAAITGHQLYLWYRDTHFCGRCATELVHDSVERMMRCPSCGGMIFPKISPAVIVAVMHGGKLLMTKYAAGRGNPNRYALIAGFTEIGETVEQTVEREVWEEVGLRVKRLRYYKSQPWSLSGSLLMGFFCEAEGDGTITRDEEELSAAAWYAPADVPDDGAKEISLTREMMGLFHRGEIPPFVER